MSATFTKNRLAYSPPIIGADSAEDYARLYQEYRPKRYVQDV